MMSKLKGSEAMKEVRWLSKVGSKLGLMAIDYSSLYYFNEVRSLVTILLLVGHLVFLQP